MRVTNNDIYSTALGMIGLQVTSEGISDYEERAPYLLASFCNMTKELDKKLRRREGLVNQLPFNSVYLALGSSFPLSEPLASAAALYVAAMLVIEENSQLSDSLYDKYCDSISTLSTELSAESASAADKRDGTYALCESIKEKYFFD